MIRITYVCKYVICNFHVLNFKVTKELPYNLQQQSLRLIFQLVQAAFTPTRTTAAALALIFADGERWWHLIYLVSTNSELHSTSTKVLSTN